MVQPGATRRPMRRVLALGLALVLVLGLVGALITITGGGRTPDAVAPPGSVVADASDPATDGRYQAFYSQELDWSGCGDGLQCADVTVPLDWDAPEGATIDLAMIRLPASGRRIASLLGNPGGPGASGVEYLRAAADSYGKALRSSFDIVYWDTRGTGESAPVTCLPNSALDEFYATDATPDTPAEEEAFVNDSQAYAQACEKNSGPVLDHVDTISTARDMDVMRAALGDETMVYLGASYGTFLGAWYAELFPWRVGRLVLDGAVDPSLTSAQYAEGQAMGFARAVQAYVDDCLTEADCPLRGSRQDAYAQLDRLMARVDEQPLPTSSRPLTQALLVTGLVQGMYSQQLWPLVTDALTEAMNGDGTSMLLLADLYLDRGEEGTYGPTLQQLAPIYCLDHAETRTVEEIAADAVRLETEYPPFGDDIGWGSLGCALWPVEAVVPTQKLAARGAGPILVVGTTQDPATPYEWAQGLAEQLSSGVLLTREGEGHTGYGMGSACIDEAVEGYLIRGVVPDDGTRCR